MKKFIYVFITMVLIIISGCEQPPVDEPSDKTAPEIISIMPKADASGVAVDTSVVISFSEAMNVESAEKAFSLLLGTAPVSGTFAWNTVKSIVTFTPADILSYSYEYKILMEYSAADMSGNVLTENVSASFTTVADVGAPQVIAEDKASDSEYDGGWSNGTNGGTGFGTWAIATSPANSGSFIYGSGADEVFGLWANPGHTVSAVRGFTAMSVNQTFSIFIDNGDLSNGAQVGFSLGDDSSEDGWLSLFFRGGESYYIIAGPSGENTSTIPFTSNGLTVEVTITGVNNYSIHLLSGDLSEQTLIGSFGAADGTAAISEFRVFNEGAGTGENYNFYFNNISISE